LKKVLIVNQNSGYLTVDVANAFGAHYDEVVVMFGLNRITQRDFDSKIKIQKTVVYNRKTALLRLLTWSLCTLHLFFLLLIKYRKHTIVFYSNPPISYLNALFFSNRFSIVVFDVYPDALKLIGVGEKNLFYTYWIKLNKKVFKQAQQMITLSDGMKQQLCNYVESDKIKVIPIWPGSNNFKPINKKDNIFLREHQWQDKFIIMYSGNMGLGHHLDFLIDLAVVLKSHEDILFLFIGEGAKKNSLQNLVKLNQLNNVKFLTWQTAAVLPFSLAAANISVVALEAGATHASVPSKTFNYMAVGSPILGIGNPNTELEKLIKQFQLGFYSEKDSIKEINEFVLELYHNNDLCAQYAQNALQASKNYTHELAKGYVF